jgi:hypothetical protein
VGALTGFLFLHASVIGYFVVGGRVRAGGRRVAYTVVPVVGALIIIPVLVLASPLALAVAGAWLIIGAIAFLIRVSHDRRTRPGVIGAP